MLAATLALAQTQYRVVSPEGRVLYTDQPPASPKARVTELQPLAPRAVTPTQPAAQINPGVVMPATAEVRAEQRACMREHAASLRLIQSSQEVARTLNNLKNDRAQGRNVAYGESELARAWKYYQSQGGTAASPEEVRVPEDPCKPIGDRFRQQAEVAQTQYRECGAARPREVRLATLSKELVENRRWLAMAEKIQEEKRRNPNFDSDSRGSGEWRNLAKMEPVQMRAALAQQFAEYRDAGGPAARIEDVQPVANPCSQGRGIAPGPSPVRREAAVIPAKK